jgi:sugar phosphate isomerase/epimerase
MRVASAGRPHLGYCTNIHPGESLAEVRQNLERYVIEVKRLVAPSCPMGVGLRLSARAARELSEPGAVAELAEFLREQGLYVFTINGFPYGEFHKGRVKEQVYLPDWLDDARLAYSDQLAVLLAELISGCDVAQGSVSTSPGAFKPRVPSSREEGQIAQRMRRHAVFLARLEERTGKTISLAIEPEPACQLETIDETIAFFEQHLFARASLRDTAQISGVSESQAEQLLRRHLGVCFDTCHMAVEFEPAKAALERLIGAGIQLGKVQISAGLQTNALSSALSAFDDGVYLHQVVRRAGGTLDRYVDLADAFDADSGEAGSDAMFRVHFHVPLFLESLGPFQSTQAYVREVLAILRQRALCQHLEVETYTWNVLPEVYRSESIEAAVARELNWVMAELVP